MLPSVSLSETGVCACFCGQCEQEAATVLFPANPCGQVFWIRSATIRRRRIIYILYRMFDAFYVLSQGMSTAEKNRRKNRGPFIMGPGQ